MLVVAGLEESVLKRLIAPLRDVEDLRKFRLAAQRFQQRVTSQVWIRKEPTRNAAAQNAQRGHPVTQSGVALCNLVCRFRIPNWLLLPCRVLASQMRNEPGVHYFTLNAGTAPPFSMNVHLPSAHTRFSISIRFN